MFRTRLAILTMVLAAGMGLHAQTGPDPDLTPPDLSTDELEKASVALSNPNYLATPGDEYVLGYSYRGQPIIVSITMDPDGQVDLGQFGVIDALGLSYNELKNQVQEKVVSYYPGSHPRFVLVKASEYIIDVYQEGRGSQGVRSWALTKLSDIVEQMGLDTRYSLRKIRVTDWDGEDRFYDFYRFLYGHSDVDNPFLRPGDTVHFEYAEFLVEVSGEVLQPGTRELLVSDSLDDVLRYVGGFTTSADQSRIQKWDVIEGKETYSLHEWGDPELFIAYSDLLRIHVPDVAETRDIMTVEINRATPSEGVADETGEEMSFGGEVVRIDVPVFNGMLASDVLVQIEHLLSPLSDLRYARLIREGVDGPILVNLQDVRNQPGLPSNLEIKPGDVLGIPTRTVFVTVTGGVYEPGRYYYTPVRYANYYITLAGGIDPTQNSHGNIIITDALGREKASDAPIEPGDNILVVQDDIVFRFDRTFGTIVTGLTFVITLTTFITLLANGL